MTKTILITGTSSGFGRETAKLFQKQGWNVVATMRSPELETELNTLSNVFVTKLDLLEIDSIKSAINLGIQKFGKIDAVVNNAGYGLMGVFESVNGEQIQKQFQVNVFGLMKVTHTILPHFRENGGGVIINLSSFGGCTALPFGSMYNSTKFAVEGFSESLSFELAPLNITVKIIEPGGVNTNFRNGIEMIKNEIPAYFPLLGNFFSRYEKTTEHLNKATVEDVAETIFRAVTDEKMQLRYVVGADSQFYIDCKVKNNDHDFVNLMRNYFIN